MDLGVHCPVRGGLAAALDYARAAGGAAMQVFPGPRQGPPSAGELAEFRAAREAGPVRRLLVHSRFTPCLASRSDERRRRSVELLSEELRLAAALGAEAFVLHAGAFSEDSDRKDGIALAAASGAQSWCLAGMKLTLLFENVPGGGRRLGASLHDLAELTAALSAQGAPCGVCVDTAHAWAAGFDLASAEGMLRFLSRLNRIVGADRVRAFHLNDTRALLGSQRESHAAWGEGYLGAEGLSALLQRPEYADRPAIVELPAGASAEAARESLDFVRALL